MGNRSMTTLSLLALIPVLACGAPSNNQKTEETRPIIPEAFQGRWRISSWHPRPVGTARAEDALLLTGQTLDMYEAPGRLGESQCESSQYEVVEDVDFSAEFGDCRNGYHPELDCREIGIEGEALLKCAATDTLPTPLRRLRGVTCRAAGFTTVEVVILSEDRAAMLLADGGGALCLQRENAKQE